MNILPKLKATINTLLVVSAILAVVAGLALPARALDFNENTAKSLAAQPQKLAEYCQAWMQQDPSNWCATDYMGVAMFEMKNYRNAIPYFVKAIHIDPNAYYAWKQIAMSESCAGNIPESERALREGVRLCGDKFDRDSWAWYGSAFGASHQWTDSINAWQHAFDMGHQAEDKRCLSAAYFNRGKDEAFARDITLAKINIAEDDVRKSLELGNPYAKESLEQLELYKKDLPTFAARKEKMEEAKATWADALKHMPPYPFSGGGGGMVNFGQMEFRRQLYQNAHPDTLYKQTSY